jgi:hypothetical protein
LPGRGDTLDAVLAFAPRYDLRLVEAIAALDDPRQPIAETCRRVGVVADRLRLPRPSYVHVRRYVLAERDRIEAERLRKEAIRDLTEEVVTDFVVGRFVHPYEVADRAAAIRERYE